MIFRPLGVGFARFFELLRLRRRELHIYSVGMQHGWKTDRPDNSEWSPLDFN